MRTAVSAVANLFSFQVCHHCLTPLPPSQVSGPAQVTFCSQPCNESALRDYYKLEAGLNLVPLSEYCTEYEERFPLLVARAACMHLSKQLQPAEQRESKGIAAKPSGSNTPQGDIWQVQFAKRQFQKNLAQHGSFLTACCVLQCSVSVTLSVVCRILNVYGPSLKHWLATAHTA